MKVIADKYEVESKLGSGASGEVFLVMHKELGKRYALKLLQVEENDCIRNLERFRQEATALQLFTHPGAVQLRDFGKESKNRYYLVTDYVDGVSLSDVLEHRGRYEVTKALELIAQLLDVLQAAHRVGIIHRDIKPENIMLQKDNDGAEVLKLLDFGIARLTADRSEKSRLTQENISIGTPEYMSPEQAAGEADIDYRADIYSAGILLYELLSGDVPFDGDTFAQIVLMQISKCPPPFDSSFSMPWGVESIVRKALQKDKNKRYPSAEDFRKDCLHAAEQLNSGVKQLSGLLSITDASKRIQLASAEVCDLKQLDTKKILCIDDEICMLYFLEHVLTGQGYSVSFTDDCAGIYERLEAHEVSLVICDLNMPGLPGTTVCKMIKEQFPEIKLLFFSSMSADILQQRTRECGADGYISKLSKPNQWLPVIEKVLAGAEETAKDENSEDALKKSVPAHFFSSN